MKTPTNVLSFLCALMLSVTASASPVDTLLERGLRSYAVGHYPEAIASFQRGYELEPRPEFLYALAQAQRMNGDCRGAVISYRAFLRTAPTERAAAPARQNMARCEELLASIPPETVAPGLTAPPAAANSDAPATTAPAAATIERPLPPPPWYRDRAGLALGVAGVAAAGVGAALWGVGEAGAKSLADAKSYGDFHGGSADAYGNERIAGIICVAVGGALIVSSIARFGIIARRR
jgi:tetratricopeptide (TPR) repeat protein